MKPDEAQALMQAAAAADAAVAETAPSSSSTPAAIDTTAPAGELGPEFQTPAQRRAARLAELTEENRSLLQMALEMLSPVLPFLPTIYTPEKITAIATAGAEVELKHNVSLGDLFGRYKEECCLAIVAAPAIVQTIVMTRAHLAAQQATLIAAPASASSSSAPASSPSSSSSSAPPAPGPLRVQPINNQGTR